MILWSNTWGRDGGSFREVKESLNEHGDTDGDIEEQEDAPSQGNRRWGDRERARVTEKTKENRTLGETKVGRYLHWGSSQLFAESEAGT